MRIDVACNHKKRRKLYAICVKQKWLCYYCGVRIYMNKSGETVSHKQSATLDHFIPLAKGGDNRQMNLVAACFPCNNTKDAKFPTEFKGFAGEHV